jgi:glycosyltransferase involved in cell wall biosynthesis
MLAEASRPIRIVRVISRLNVGGPALHVLWMCHKLESMGYRSLLVSGSESPREGDMLNLSRELGVTPVMVPEMGREVSPLADLKALLRMTRLLRAARPQIVHTHTAKAGALGRLAAQLTGVPVRVHTHHGHYLHGYFSDARTKTFVFYERLLRRITTHLVTVSDTVRRDLINAGMARAGDISVIPPGLDFDQPPAPVTGAFRKHLGVAPGDLLVGAVARLVPVKGLDDFLEAARLVLARSLPRAATFVLIGDGDLRPQLEERVRTWGLESRIRFAGIVRDMAGVHADLDLLVLSSRNEGMPVAVIEALASGTPVVATRVGGVPDLLEGIDSAVMVAPGDPARLADAIAAVAADLDEYRGRARRQIAAARQRYSVDRAAADLDRLYRSLLLRKGLPPPPPREE